MNLTATEIQHRQREGFRRMGYAYEALSEWQRVTYARIVVFWNRHYLIEHGTYTDDMRQMLEDLKTGEKT